jgi:hypothetical protein
MREIKLSVSDDLLDQLNAAAAAAGIPRAQLIRSRIANCNAGGLQLSPSDYHHLVADAAAFMRNDFPRHQIETLTAYVIQRLDQHSRQTATIDQSAS